MYEGFFKLHSRPFIAAPQTNRYFPATLIEQARKTLARCIERGEGAGLIIGPSGTGKTLLCQMLVEEFEGRFSTVLLSGGLSTRQALLQAILYELEQPYRGLDEGELRLALLDFLQPKPEGNDALLLVIDEAHSLTWRLFEEVRTITNIVRGGQSRVRVVLAGNPVLEERFASPKLSSFSQRLAARCYLESLDASETADYVRAAIASVGGDPAQVFHDEALRSVYRATDGIARLINQVCDHALILASLAGIRRLTSDVIDEAWADLQQLPTPWAGSAGPSAAASHVVEFGSLSDAPDEPLEAIPFRSAPTHSLHVTDDDDDALEPIADSLSHSEDDFEPAGSIGTEVDLEFPEFGDPFGEEFAEEEVVLDHYTGDEEIFADVPRVTSREGQQLGSMLEPLDISVPRAVTSERSTFLYGEPALDEMASETILPPLVAFGSPERSMLPEPSDSRPVDLPLGISGSIPHSQIGPLAREATLARMQMLSGGTATQPRASDLIVIDDELSPAKPIVPLPVVRRKSEYRQLFSKLRRG